MQKVVGTKSPIAGFFQDQKLLRFKRGEVILRPDYLNPGIYYIEKGYVKVYSISLDGEEKIHLIFKAGDLFPLLWVFKDINREVFYEAIVDVFARRSTRDIFLKYLNESPVASRELVGKVLTISNVYVDRIGDLEYIKSYPRLVSHLISLSARFGIKNGKKIIVDVPLTHREIAASINMTRETASRDIEELERRELISIRGKYITILDVKKLKGELINYSEKSRL